MTARPNCPPAEEGEAVQDMPDAVLRRALRVAFAAGADRIAAVSGLVPDPDRCTGAHR